MFHLHFFHYLYALPFFLHVPIVSLLIQTNYACLFLWPSVFWWVYNFFLTYFLELSVDSTLTVANSSDVLHHISLTYLWFQISATAVDSSSPQGQFLWHALYIFLPSILGNSPKPHSLLGWEGLILTLSEIGSSGATL